MLDLLLKNLFTLKFFKFLSLFLVCWWKNINGEWFKNLYYYLITQTIIFLGIIGKTVVPLMLDLLIFPKVTKMLSKLPLELSDPSPLPLMLPNLLSNSTVQVMFFSKDNLRSGVKAYSSKYVRGGSLFMSTHFCLCFWPPTHSLFKDVYN